MAAAGGNPSLTLSSDIVFALKGMPLVNEAADFLLYIYVLGAATAIALNLMLLCTALFRSDGILISCGLCCVFVIWIAAVLAGRFLVVKKDIL